MAEKGGSHQIVRVTGGYDRNETGSMGAEWSYLACLSRSALYSTYMSRLFVGILPKDAYLGFKFSPTPLRDLVGRSRQFAERLGKTGVQLKDYLLNTSRKVFVIRTAQVKRPLVRIVFVRLFPQVKGDGSGDHRHTGDRVFQARRWKSRRHRRRSGACLGHATYCRRLNREREDRTSG
jgi:hypothetical protein